MTSINFRFSATLVLWVRPRSAQRDLNVETDEPLTPECWGAFSCICLALHWRRCRAQAARWIYLSDKAIGEDRLSWEDLRSWDVLPRHSITQFKVQAPRI